MASHTGLFYAFAKWRTTEHHRYLIIFASREIADEWWRAVQFSGIHSHSNISRISAQFYYNDDDEGDLIPATVREKGCASHFNDRVFFTLLNDLGGRIISVLPVLSYTEHKSGDRFFIRSRLQPNLFWYYDAEAQRVIASTVGRSSFTIRIVGGQYPDGTIIIGQDTIAITTGEFDTVRITLKQGGAVSSVWPAVKEGAQVSPASTRPVKEGALVGAENATDFKFKDFIQGFALGGKVADGMAIKRSTTDGESWELFN